MKGSILTSPPTSPTVYTQVRKTDPQKMSFVGCVIDDSPNALQIWEGALRWRDNTPYKTKGNQQKVIKVKAPLFKGDQQELITLNKKVALLSKGEYGYFNTIFGYCKRNEVKGKG